MSRYSQYFYAFIVLLLIFGVGAYVYTQPDLNIPLFTVAPPCSKPLTYTVGTIDPRFNLTHDQIVTKLKDAADLWNTAAGKPMLAYTDDPHAMPVNFVYDARQQTLSLGQKIDTTEASQQTERAAIDDLQKNYLAAEQTYAAAVAAFNTASEQYAAEVKRVNASGGADSTTYARLEAERTRLNTQQAALKTQGDALQAQGEALDARIKAFNASVGQINQVVKVFNSTVGGDFEEGQYVRDASGIQHIDIYAYKNQSELLHSLAHEFGHSLGLEHNDNPASIMFPYNKSSVVLSTDDLAALKAACRL